MSHGVYTGRYLGMPDEEVIQHARQGESDAVECLITRYRPFVETKAKAFFVLGADRDDVMQEGLIGLCKAIRNYRDDRVVKFRPFAELCVTRQIITAVKTATRYKHRLLNQSISLHQQYGAGETTTLLDTLSSPHPNADAEEAIEITQDLQRLALESLSKLERQVLRSYLDGKTYREISEELHCRTKSVDNALQRVKKKIGILLQH